MNSEKQTKVFGIIAVIFLIAIDQIIKAWAFENLRPIGTQDFINGFIRLTYVENTGAAFGIFQNNTLALGIISGLLLVGILIAVVIDKIKDNFLVWTVLIIFAGGAGNVIDRLTRGFVIDYLDFEVGFLKNFPVFNFADCCVTIGAVLLIGYIIFFDGKARKEESLE